jgi:hypothetical protein
MELLFPIFGVAGLWIGTELTIGDQGTVYLYWFSTGLEGIQQCMK